MRIVVLLVAISCTFPMALSADQVWLRSGKSLEGQFSRLEDGRVEIKTDFGSFRLAADQVVRVERGKTFEQEILAELADLHAFDIEGRYALAQRCKQKNAFSLERKILSGILDVDTDHAQARRDLGYQRVDDRWLTENELHEQRGEIRFRDRWMQPEDMEKILSEEARIARLAAERQSQALQEALVQLRLTYMEAEIQDLHRRQAAREFYGDEVGYPIYPYPYGIRYRHDKTAPRDQLPGQSGDGASALAPSTPGWQSWLQSRGVPLTRR